MTNFRLFQPKKFADNNFKFDKKGGKFSKNDKKHCGNYEQFLHFPHSVFKRLVLRTRKNNGLFGKGLTLYHTIKT